MTIRRWESGDVSPEEIQKIAKALNTSVEYLLDLQDKNNIKQQMDAALELADRSSDEDFELKEPISAGMTDNMIIIKDWNTQQTYYFPNNEKEENSSLILQTVYSILELLQPLGIL